MRRTVVIITFLVLISNPGTSACPPETFKENDTSNNTECTKCAPKCDGGQVEVRPCSITKNRACQCPQGRYFDKGLAFCEVCKICKTGFVISRNCSPVENTVCVRKTIRQPTQPQAGPTLWNVPSPTEKSPKVTPLAETSEQPFTATMRSSDEPVRHIYIKEPAVYKVLAIIFGSMILLIGIAVLLAFLKMFRRQNQWKLPRGTLASAEGSDVSLIGAHDTTIKLRDAPASIVEDLAELLNPPSTKNWRRLAGRLGFTQQEVCNFALTKTEATQSLLQEWSTREGATIGRLYRVLLDMGRHDVAKVLQCSLPPHGTLV